MENIILPSGKAVLVCEPYRPAEAILATFVGRDRELKMIAAAWLGGGRFPPLSPLVVGEPGVGKNRLVYELSMPAIPSPAFNDLRFPPSRGTTRNDMGFLGGPMAVLWAEISDTEPQEIFRVELGRVVFWPEQANTFLQRAVETSAASRSIGFNASPPTWKVSAKKCAPRCAYLRLPNRIAYVPAFGNK